MSGVRRVKLTGIQPTIELRLRNNLFFVTYPQIDSELVMAFQRPDAAEEIAVNSFYGSPFYDMIPVVDYNTPYPRPWLSYPPVIDRSCLIRTSRW